MSDDFNAGGSLGALAWNGALFLTAINSLSNGPFAISALAAMAVSTFAALGAMGEWGWAQKHSYLRHDRGNAEYEKRKKRHNTANSTAILTTVLATILTGVAFAAGELPGS